MAKGKIDESFRDTNKKAVLVTGGSGFVGKHVVPTLADSGHSVVSMYHMRLPETHANVFPVCSDLGSVELLGAPLRGVETVVHLSWQSNLMSSADEIKFDPSYAQSGPNVRLLNNLLKAMEKAGTKRIIFVSAVGANRRAKTSFLKEKYLAEVAVLNSNIPEKIIVRSNLVFNANKSNDQFIRSMMNVMKFPGFYPVPKVSSKIAPLHIQDLSEVLRDLVEHKMDKGSAILELAGPDEFQVEDLFKLVSDRFSSGSKLQLRGSLGDSLVSVFERRGEFYSAIGPKLRDFLSVGNLRDRNTDTDNPLESILPKKRKSFREALSG